MNQTICLTSAHDLEDLTDHIHSRTFGRLHDLCVSLTNDGQLRISATAHSRFVLQLAEWAVLEQVASNEVEFAISVPVSSPQFFGVEK